VEFNEDSRFFAASRCDGEARKVGTRGQVCADRNVTGPKAGPLLSFFLSSLELSDTHVYAPQIRARLGTAAHFCEVKSATGKNERLEHAAKPRTPPWRQPRCKSIVSLVNSHTKAARIGWHLWEIDLRFAPGLPPGRKRHRSPSRSARPLVLYEKGFKLKPFWQSSLLPSMFFTSNIKEFV